MLMMTAAALSWRLPQWARTVARVSLSSFFASILNSSRFGVGLNSKVSSTLWEGSLNRFRLLQCCARCVQGTMCVVSVFLSYLSFFHCRTCVVCQSSALVWPVTETPYLRTFVGSLLTDFSFFFPPSLNSLPLFFLYLCHMPVTNTQCVLIWNYRWFIADSYCEQMRGKVDKF